MNRTSVFLRGAVGLPLDFGSQIVAVVNERLGDLVSRLSPGFAMDLPLRSLEGHLQDLRLQTLANAKSDYHTVQFEVTSTRTAKPFERVNVVFQDWDSHSAWGMGSLGLDAAVSAVDAMSDHWQIEEGGCSVGVSSHDRRGKKDLVIRRSDLELEDQWPRKRKGDLLGIAPVQWFGSAFVEAFGGDAVFESLPDGWAERVAPGLWKVFGVEDPEDPDAFELEVWSDRERAIIEALGPQFFFNIETGELASEFVEIPIASQYPVYLWDKASGQLVIHEPDGSMRPANLEDPPSLPVAEDPVGPRDMAHLVVERMNGLLGDESFEVDDQLYWVEQHLQSLSSLDDVWVEAFSVWLGEHVIKGILDASWVEHDGRWVVSSSRGVFDPEQVVRATVGSEERVESRVMVKAACEAMGIPLP